MESLYSCLILVRLTGSDAYLVFLGLLTKESTELEYFNEE